MSEQLSEIRTRATNQGDDSRYKQWRLVV